MGVVKRLPCPKCRAWGKDSSGDNLAEYDDGHQWCYSCKYFVAAPLESRVRKYSVPQGVTEVPTHSTNNPLANFPSDTSHYLPIKCLDWVGKYGLTRYEISANMFQWSESRNLLVMPVYRDTAHIELLWWQGRYFGVNDKAPRYYTGGTPLKDLHIIDNCQVTYRKKTLIFVEDMISAIKVGRHYPTLVLCGSHIPLELIQRVKSMGYESIGIWLDADKAREAVKSAMRSSQILPAFVVYSPNDPKTYDDQYIVNIIPVQSNQPLVNTGGK